MLPDATVEMSIHDAGHEATHYELIRINETSGHHIQLYEFQLDSDAMIKVFDESIENSGRYRYVVVAWKNNVVIDQVTSIVDVSYETPIIENTLDEIISSEMSMISNNMLTLDVTLQNNQTIFQLASAKPFLESVICVTDINHTIVKILSATSTDADGLLRKKFSSAGLPNGLCVFSVRVGIETFNGVLPLQ
ncbi:MAG TPA: hypothetical protein VD927_01215 [Chryseosolibacter sp.]|nr:hypothetical protein [Chryseosolibacter sp.]